MQLHKSTLQALILGGATCFILFAASAEVKPQPTRGLQSSASPAEQTDLSETELTQLLAADLHLPNPRAVAFQSEQSYTYLPTSAQDKIKEAATLYARQKRAVAQVGAQKLLSLVPNLLVYLDYPSGANVPSSAPQEEVYATEVRSSWPAFDALLKLGEAATPEIEKFILSDNQELRLRLTALQVLRQIDSQQSEEVGKTLSLSMERVGQKGAVDRIVSIATGQLLFWGVVDIAPITMTKAEIVELLSIAKHLKAPSFVAGRPNLPEHKMYSQQKQAIYEVGELGLVELVPNLIAYMDYPSSRGAGLVVTASSFTLKGRRRDWPAFDAIMKIGKSALPALEAAVQDKSKELMFRLSALKALKDMESERAVRLGEILKQEFTQLANKDAILRVESALIDGPQPRRK